MAFGFERFLYRMNILVLGAVFALLAPATPIVASWYPEYPGILWLFPLAALGFSMLLWYLIRLNIPRLIEWGFVTDRRKAPRFESYRGLERYLKIGLPVLVMSLQMLVLIFLLYCLLLFMKSPWMEDLLMEIAARQ